MKRSFSRLTATLVPPAVMLAVVLVAWHLAVVQFSIPRYLLPKPDEVVREGWERRVELVRAASITAVASMEGFGASLVVGLSIAFTFSQSRLLARAAYPYAIFLQTVPIVAIAPLIVVWFGNGLQSVAIVAFIISLFPIVTNATAGLTTIDRSLLELFELYGANRWQTLWKLRLPHSVPYIVAGAKISAGLSVVGAIVGEVFAGYGSQGGGLGKLISRSNDRVAMTVLFAALLTSTLLGVAVFVAVSLAGGWLTARFRGELPGRD